ncbi:DUF4870 domain-containing protein [Demequina sediminicola]|uniref:DUF4870 domain-containing protein n=1 Tax=Demequina sediminicola TaxID=1095026 RepID=UPI0007853384|nr:DUF4870 domain-containing protein [Demequina sediminicola]
MSTPTPEQQPREDSQGTGPVPPPSAPHTQGQQPNGAPYAAPAPMLESDARMYAMFIHISAVIGAVISASFFGFVAPLVLWLIFRERSALVHHQGRQQLNLQLTGLLVGIAAVIIGVISFGLGFLVTAPLWLAFWIYSIVASVMAGVKANRGEYSRFRLAIPFFK